MQKRWLSTPWRRLALLVCGGALILGGCDPGIQATVENGIITASNSFLAAFLQAAVQLGQEAANANVNGA